MSKAQFEQDVAFLDAVSHELAMAASEEAAGQPESAEERAMVDAVDRKARDVLRTLRRDAFEELRCTRSTRNRRGIPERIAAMTREAIVERLRELHRIAPVRYQFGYRKLEALSLKELRLRLTDIEDALAAGGE